MQSSSRGYKAISLVLVVSLLAHTTPLYTAAGRDDMRVRNVNFEETDGKIVIYYDLIGKRNKKYNVTLSLRRKADRFFRHSPEVLEGDVGADVLAGSNRTISWEVSKEFPQGLEGDDYYFVVNAEPVSGGTSPLVWLGAAVTVLGGAAAYFLLSAQKEEPTPVGRIGFPLAPARP